MRKLTIGSLAMLVSLLWCNISQAAVPGTLTYQGRLTDSSGTPASGTVSMTFAIYGVSTGGTVLWMETQSSVSVASGIFTVTLGSVTPIPSTVFSNTDLYLGIKVGADAEMTPRQKLHSVPFAIKAGVADIANSVEDGAITDAKISGTISSSKISSTGLNADLLDGLDSTTFMRTDQNNVTSGNLTLGGGAKIGNDTSSCDASKAGTIRWNGSTTFEGCNGSSWVSFATNKISTQVTTSNAISTTSTTWVDIPNMTATVTTGNSPVLIIASMPSVYIASGGGYYRIIIDGVEKTNYVTVVNPWPITLIWLENLAAGQHTIKVQWYATSPGNLQATYRSLTIKEF